MEGSQIKSGVIMERIKLNVITEGNQIEQKPPGINQFVQQLQNQRVLAIGLGGDIEQFYRVLFNPQRNRIWVGVKPDVQQYFKQFLDERPNQNVGLLLFLQKNFPHDKERFYRKEKMKSAGVETRDVVWLMIDVEQNLREKLKCQSYELWEVKQEPGQGMVLQHQVQKSLLELPRQALERTQKTKQEHVSEKKRSYTI